jgi:ADP-heptose:LPS heptosyltransferase
MSGERRHVLIARLDNTGDVLLSGPAVRAVAATARVTYVCRRGAAEAAAMLPGVERILVARADWIEADAEPVTRARTFALVDALAALGCDQAVVLTSFHQSPLPFALLLRLAGLPTVAAISTDYAGSLLTVRHRVDDGIHEVLRNLSLVATLGYRLPTGDDGRLRVLAGSTPPAIVPDGPYVVLHPGASVPARAWSLERMAVVAAGLAAEGWRVAVTGGRGEAAATAWVCRYAAGHRDAEGRSAVVDLGGCTNLATLAGVLAGARAVVTGNTGPAHLAAAVGTPVVSIYAPTVPHVRWRPWGVPHVLLGDQDIACAGCRARECPVAGHPCIDALDPVEVIAAIDALAPASRAVPA